MSAMRIPYLATAALSGALFGAGLYVSQMVDPLKVLRFLDFTAIPGGDWDPSLAFVIGPAILVMFIAVRIGSSRPAPLFDSGFHEPEYRKVNVRLIGGAALFGIGWGMSGICPGPAISLVAFQPEGIWLFLAAMFAGSLAGSLVMPTGRSRLADVAP